MIARESAYTYKGKATDVRQIGRELGVRYVLEGSVRRIGDTLRVNVQLVSAETGAHLWSDRFDEAISQLAAGQQQIIARMKDTIGVSMVDIEAARSLRERPDQSRCIRPDPAGALVGASAADAATGQGDMALYERALALDPSSVPAMVGVAYQLIDAAPSRRLGQFREHASAPGNCWRRRARWSRGRRRSSTPRSIGCGRWAVARR